MKNDKFGVGRFVGGRALSLVWVTLVLVTAGSAQADLILGEPTNVLSDAARMISYRHQEHAWETPDGAKHLLINRGSLSPGASLVLHSRFDEGGEWQQTVALGQTTADDSADGAWVDDQLWVAFSKNESEIAFATVNYHPLSDDWSLSHEESVYLDDLHLAYNPAFVVDGAGAVWCAFLTEHRVTQETSIKMFFRPSGGGAWLDTGLTFGEVNDTPLSRSARPVLTRGGVGMVYTVSGTVFWARRWDAWPVDRPWNEQTLYVVSGQQSDPYGSHFSIAWDSLGDLHMALTDRGRLRYFHLPEEAFLWRSRWITWDIGAKYPQVSAHAASDVVFVSAATDHGHIKLLEGADQGETFAASDLLMPPPAGPGVTHRTPRVEMPGMVSGSLWVVQQYQVQQFPTPALQSLLYFPVAP